MSQPIIITLGNALTLSTSIGSRDPATGTLTLTDDSSLKLLVRLPDATEIVLSPVNYGTGLYYVEYLPAELGVYEWRWEATGSVQGTDEGSFEVTSSYVARVTDLTDIRVIGPRVQRAVEGVVQQDWQLTPDEIRDVTADACSDILLYTGSVFGSQMIVTARDPITLAPTEWKLSVELGPSEASVIAAQAALTYFYHRFAGQKMSEQISDEASSWEYSLSPNLLIAQLKLLQDTRDKALEAVAAQQGGMDRYVSFLGVRDTLVSRYIEPWVYGHPEGFGIGAGGLEGDFRFDPLPSGGGSFIAP